MADSNIKKVRIKKADLPPMSSAENGYVVRYRIVSEDKNRVSHWSPTKIVLPQFTYTSGTITHNKTGTINLIVWDAVKILKGTTFINNETTYDVWLKWDKSDNGDWIYRERVTGTSLSIITPSDYTINGVLQGSIPNRLSAEIYINSNPPTRAYTTLRVYQGGPWTV